MLRNPFKRQSKRPLYALLLQQQPNGTAIQAIGPDVPMIDAKRMLLEALSAIERQEQAQQQSRER